MYLLHVYSCQCQDLTELSLCFLDDIRRLIGSDTTRQGVIRVFNMFQHPTLNKRLVYVILEGILETLFPENKFEELFRKLHSRSPRLRKELRPNSSVASLTVTNAQRAVGKWKR